MHPLFHNKQREENMGIDLKTIITSRKKMGLHRYYGGDKRGTMIQIDIGNQFIQLTQTQIKELITQLLRVL